MSFLHMLIWCCFLLFSASLLTSEAASCTDEACRSETSWSQVSIEQADGLGLDELAVQLLQKTSRGKNFQSPVPLKAVPEPVVPSASPVPLKAVPEPVVPEAPVDPIPLVAAPSPQEIVDPAPAPQVIVDPIPASPAPQVIVDPIPASPAPQEIVTPPLAVATAPPPEQVLSPVPIRTDTETTEAPAPETTTAAPKRSTVQPFAPKEVNDGKAIPINCTGHGTPIQLLKLKGGFAIQELNIETGSYKNLFEIPYELVQGFFSDINGCGISPIDSIIYCSMHTALTSYIVRLSPGVVEFVARLKSWTIYNTGTFNPAGQYFLANNTAHFTVIDNVHTFKGSSDKNDPALTNLANVPSYQPQGWFSVSDVVTFRRDLKGNGLEEEYIASMAGPRLQIAKWNGNGFPESWVVHTAQGDWGDIWGAGWHFNGRIFFSHNKGFGVFEIPLKRVNVWNPNANLTLNYVGPSKKTYNNDGMNCLYSPDPWVTKVFSFDCASHGVPLQLTQGPGGVSVKKLDMSTGYLLDIYDIPFKRTSPPFSFLNGIGINPQDHIPYGALMFDKAPGNIFFVRFDWEKIEFVGKMTGSFNPIAGTFDQAGNYFFLSHPDEGVGTLYKIPGLDEVKGYSSPEDKLLADYSQLSGIQMTDMYQMADIVAITYDATGQGDFTDYILGINRDQQVVVVKFEDPVPQSRVWRFYSNEVLDQYGAKLNFGAAWNFQGRLMFASNDGVGVFEAVDYNAATGYVRLQEVGKSSNSEITDGFNCPSASPFMGNHTLVQPPTINIAGSIK